MEDPIQIQLALSIIEIQREKILKLAEMVQKLQEENDFLKKENTAIRGFPNE